LLPEDWKAGFTRSVGLTSAVPTPKPGPAAAFGPKAYLPPGGGSGRLALEGQALLERR